MFQNLVTRVGYSSLKVEEDCDLLLIRWREGLQTHEVT